jgi:VCBS repeat-containing protein
MTTATLMLALEPRILLDGAALLTGLDGIDESNHNSEIDSPPLLDFTPPPPTQIIIIDESVKDRETILQGIDTTTPIHILDSEWSGVEQISNILSSYQNLDSVHIISHGSAGSITIGSTTLNNNTIDTYQTGLQQWGKSLSTSGDLLLYGCEVGKGEDGITFIQDISRLTEADVAASNDVTGSVELGGNWLLESKFGTIESIEIGSSYYNHTLAAPTASADTNSIYEDGTTTSKTAAGGLLSNDLDGDNDPLSVSQIGATIDQNIDIIGQYGTLNWETDGSYIYTINNSNSAVQELSSSTSLTDQFTYTVSDGQSGSDDSTLSITIIGTNDAPILTVTNIAATEDGAAITNTATTSDIDSSNITYSVNSMGAGNGTASIDYNTGVYIYDPGSDFQNLTSGETSQVSFNVVASDGNLTDTESVTVIVTGVNDSPNIATNNKITVLDGNNNSVTITSGYLNEGDPDDSGADLTYTVTATPLNGDLKLNGAILGTNGTFTQQDILNSKVTYTHNGTGTANDSFQFSLADGGEDGATAATGTFTIQYGPLLTIPADITYTEDFVDENAAEDHLLAIAPTITLSDRDNTTLSSATIKISAGKTTGDYLGFTNNGVDQGNISGNYSSSSGILSLTSTGATATVEQWQSALRAVTFKTTNENPTESFTTRTIVWKTDDGTYLGGDGNEVSNTVTVTPTNDSPTITTNNKITVLDGNGQNIIITSSYLNNSDPDNGNTELTYTVTTAPTNGEIQLNGIGIGVAGTFTQQDVLDNKLSYTHNGTGTANDSFQFSLADGGEDGATAATGTFTIQYGPLLTTPADITYTEDFVGATPAEDHLLAIAPTITLSDRDNTTLSSATIKISAGKTTGDYLGFTNNGVDQGNISGNYSSSSGILSLTSTGATATVEQWQSALRAVTFKTTNENPTESFTTRTIVWKTDDGTYLGGDGNEVSNTVTVTPTNDSPTLSAGSISKSENSLEIGVTVDAVTSNLLNGVSDIDDNSSVVSISVVNGDVANLGSAITTTLSYIDADSVTKTQDISLTVNSDGSYSIAAFDLDALPLGSNATGSFTYQVKDDDNFTSNTVTATVTVTGTNDAPTLTTAGSINSSEDILEGGIIVNTATSNLLSNITDIDDINSTLVIGTLNESSSNVGSATTISLSYTDADGANQTQNINLTLNSDGSYSISPFNFDTLPLGNSATGSFTYQVKDDSGALSTAKTATITISGTNDAPLLTAGDISSNEDSLEAGISVDAATSNLLNSATDIDDNSSVLSISVVNGDVANLGSAITTTLSYIDADSVTKTQDISLTVNSDGSYSIAAFDLDALPLGSNATGSFTYQVKDDSNALSSTKTATITISGINDTPTISSNIPVKFTNIALSPEGESVADLIARSDISDVDANALKGVAITGLTYDDKGGWEYSIDNGRNFLRIDSLSDNKAILLENSASHKLRYISEMGHTGGDHILKIRAWDQSRTPTGTSYYGMIVTDINEELVKSDSAISQQSINWSARTYDKPYPAYYSTPQPTYSFSSSASTAGGSSSSGGANLSPMSYSASSSDSGSNSSSNISSLSAISTLSSNSTAPNISSNSGGAGGGGAGGGGAGGGGAGGGGAGGGGAGGGGAGGGGAGGGGAGGGGAGGGGAGGGGAGGGGAGGGGAGGGGAGGGGTGGGGAGGGGTGGGGAGGGGAGGGGAGGGGAGGGGDRGGGAGGGGAGGGGAGDGGAEGGAESPTKDSDNSEPKKYQDSIEEAIEDTVEDEDKLKESSDEVTESVKENTEIADEDVTNITTQTSNQTTSAPVATIGTTSTSSATLQPPTVSTPINTLPPNLQLQAVEGLNNLIEPLQCPMRAIDKIYIPLESTPQDSGGGLSSQLNNFKIEAVAATNQLYSALHKLG